MEKLATKVGLCLKRNNIPFVIGGSRDLFKSITDAYLAHEAPIKVTYLQFTHQLDAFAANDPFQTKLNSRNVTLLDRLPENHRLIVFGVDGARTP